VMKSMRSSGIVISLSLAGPAGATQSGPEAW
jgi:hypothetical protein